MFKQIGNGLKKWIHGNQNEVPPSVTADSTLAEIISLYPRALDLLRDSYRLPSHEIILSWSLERLVHAHQLPSAQIVYMQIQLFHQAHPLEALPAREAKQRIDREPGLMVLDVREPWERKMGALPRSQPLDAALWEEITGRWEKTRAILLYCHFGIRSQDAAARLSECGFEKIVVLRGGIDAWSQEVDPQIPRYEQAWC